MDPLPSSALQINCRGQRGANIQMSSQRTRTLCSLLCNYAELHCMIFGQSLGQAVASMALIGELVSHSSSVSYQGIICDISLLYSRHSVILKHNQVTIHSVVIKCCRKYDLKENWLNFIPWNWPLSLEEVVRSPWCPLQLFLGALEGDVVPIIMQVSSLSCVAGVLYFWKICYFENDKPPLPLDFCSTKTHLQLYCSYFRWAISITTFKAKSSTTSWHKLDIETSMGLMVGCYIFSELH